MEVELISHGSPLPSYPVHGSNLQKPASWHKPCPFHRGGKTEAQRAQWLASGT